MLPPGPSGLPVPREEWLRGLQGHPCGQEMSAVVATRHRLRGPAVADVGYLITQELTAESGRRLVSCKYVNAGKR